MVRFKTVEQGVRARKGGQNKLGLQGTIGQLNKQVNELEPLVMIEPKTGLLNERGMWNDMRRKIAEIGRDTESTDKKEGLGLVFYDFINFKVVNDAIGQENGNTVLQEGAKYIREEHRGQDGVGRYGGDEDLVVLKVASEEELFTILNVGRHERSGAEGAAILDSINAKLKLFMKNKFASFVQQHGEMPGTLRSAYCFVTNEEIMDNDQEGLEQIIRTRINELSIVVKRK